MYVFPLSEAVETDRDVETETKTFMAIKCFNFCPIKSRKFADLGPVFIVCHSDKLDEPSRSVSRNSD